MLKGKLFYSNCLFEALRAWVRAPLRVRIVNLTHMAEHPKAIHFGWRVGKRTYHFFSEHQANKPWWKDLFFKGKIGRVRCP